MNINLSPETAILACFVVLCLLIHYLTLLGNRAINSQKLKEAQESYVTAQKRWIEEYHRQDIHIKDLTEIAKQMKQRADFDIVTNKTPLEHSVYFAGFRGYEKAVLTEIDNLFAQKNYWRPETATPNAAIVAYNKQIHEEITKAIKALND